MEQPQKTIISDLDLSYPGYIVIASLSQATAAKIHKIQDELAAQLPEGSLWLPRNEQLHVTLLHVVTDGIAPKNANNPALFATVKDNAIRALDAAIPTELDIKLELEFIGSSPPALIVKWRDYGAYDEIRSKFLERFNLPEGTRQPPNIVHTTIARFRKEIDYKAVERAVASIKRPEITEHTTSFHLAMVTKALLQEHEVLETFPRAKTA